MFHHFRDDDHPDGQGAILDRQLELIIKSIGRKRILAAEQWSDLVLKGELPNDAVCITLDDNLRCQYDVAWPVLRRHDISAFWFVYSGPLVGRQEKIEVYRYFRSVTYPDFDAFYIDFFKALTTLGTRELVDLRLKDFDHKKYLSDFPFYTVRDKVFRYTRDWILSAEQYEATMSEMMRQNGFSADGLEKRLWMDDTCLRELSARGQTIGLHSHTHPTQMARLSKSAQEEEYKTNLETLEKILGTRPSCVSHPCNSYNQDTLDLLREMAITIGFRANLREPLYGLPLLELPRNDHMNVLKEIEAQ